MTSYGYDVMSNRTSMTDALSQVTNYEYDDFNRLKKIIYPAATTGATRLQETIEYDASGNVKKRTDTAGHETNYLYDAADRLTTITDPASQATNFEYNARSQNTAVVDALNQRYTFAYDPLGRVTQTTRAGLSMSYVYDAVGNRTQRTDYNNAATNYTYDNLNRLTTVSYPDATTVTYGFDALSRPASAANANGTVTFAYDNRGRLATTTDVFNQTVGYSYDANGNRAAMTLGGSVNASYVYDSVNRLTQLNDSASLAVTHAYDVTNKLTSRNLPNGVATTYEYDGLDRLTRLRDATAITTIADNQYSYNTANQITQIADPGGAHAYGYDYVDRLSSATYPGTTAESYSYDNVGNRTASHRSATYGYQPFNELTSTTSTIYSYDNNGNQIAKTDASGITQYTWDYENRLTCVTKADGTVVEHKYDALGRRIQRRKSISSPLPLPADVTNFVYDGQDVIQDRNDAGVVISSYLNGPGIDNKLRQTTVAASLYFVQDHLGSTRALTDATGNVVEQQQYDSFGNSTGSALTRYGYTGRELDSDTGLLYYRARWHDPQIGRFISEDPIGFGGGVNWYAYVGNSPVGALDPYGLAKCNPQYCKKLLEQIVGKANGFFNNFRPYKDSGFVDQGGRPWSHAGRSGITGPGQHYNGLIDRQRGLTTDILDYIANCIDKGPPPPGLERAIDAAKTHVPWPVNIPTREELRMREESHRQMERFWEKVLIGDLAVGAVLLRAPLPALPRVVRWLLPAFAP